MAPFFVSSLSRRQKGAWQQETAKKSQSYSIRATMSVVDDSPTVCVLCVFKSANDMRADRCFYGYPLERWGKRCCPSFKSVVDSNKIKMVVLACIDHVPDAFSIFTL